jgi:hypothetical protein
MYTDYEELCIMADLCIQRATECLAAAHYYSSCAAPDNAEMFELRAGEYFTRYGDACDAMRHYCDDDGYYCH